MAGSRREGFNWSRSAFNAAGARVGGQGAGAAACASGAGHGAEELARQAGKGLHEAPYAFADPPPPAAPAQPATETVRLAVHPEVGVGIEVAFLTGQGFLVESVAPEPGQPELREGDVIAAVGGRSLALESEDDADEAFVSELVDGVELLVVRAAAAELAEVAEAKAPCPGAVWLGAEREDEQSGGTLADVVDDRPLASAVAVGEPPEGLAAVAPHSEATRDPMDAQESLGALFTKLTTPGPAVAAPCGRVPPAPFLEPEAPPPASDGPESLGALFTALTAQGARAVTPPQAAAAPFLAAESEEPAEAAEAAEVAEAAEAEEAAEAAEAAEAMEPLAAASLPATALAPVGDVAEAAACEQEASSPEAADAGDEEADEEVCSPALLAPLVEGRASPRSASAPSAGAWLGEGRGSAGNDPSQASREAEVAAEEAEGAEEAREAEGARGAIANAEAEEAEEIPLPTSWLGIAAPEAEEAEEPSWEPEGARGVEEEEAEEVPLPHAWTELAAPEVEEAEAEEEEAEEVPLPHAWVGLAAPEAPEPEGEVPMPRAFAGGAPPPPRAALAESLAGAGAPPPPLPAFAAAAAPPLEAAEPWAEAVEVEEEEAEEAQEPEEVPLPRSWSGSGAGSLVQAGADEGALAPEELPAPSGLVGLRLGGGGAAMRAMPVDFNERYKEPQPSAVTAVSSTALMPASSSSWGTLAQRPVALTGGRSGLEPVHCKVRDLWDWLTEVSLQEYYVPATRWCADMGAVSLEELAENVEDFGEAVGLKPIERQRVRKWASQVLWQAEGGGDAGAPAPSMLPLEACSPAEAWTFPPQHGDFIAAPVSNRAVASHGAGPPTGAGSLRASGGAGPLSGRGVAGTSGGARAMGGAGALGGGAEEDPGRAATPAPVYTSRSVRLAMDSSGNTGLDLQWDEEWGIMVQHVDPLPGQPGLAAGDYILAIDGCSLRHRTPEDCDGVFSERLQNGAVLSVISPSRAPEPVQAQLARPGGKGKGHIQPPQRSTPPWQLLRPPDPRLGKGQRGGYSASRMWTRFRGPPW